MYEMAPLDRRQYTPPLVQKGIEPFMSQQELQVGFSPKLEGQ
jgi:hypothetical protein